MSVNILVAVEATSDQKVYKVYNLNNIALPGVCKNSDTLSHTYTRLHTLVTSTATNDT